MFDLKVIELLDRLTLLNNEEIHEYDLSIGPIENLSILRLELTTNLSREKITRLFYLHEKVNCLIEEGLSKKKVYEFTEDSKERVYLDAKFLLKDIPAELTYYSTFLSELLNEFEGLAIAQFEWEKNPLVLNISVAHLGLLLGSLYSIGVLNKQQITKREFARLISKFCCTNKQSSLSVNALVNSMGTSKGSEITSFSGDFLKKIDLAAQEFKVDLERERNQP